MTNLRKLIRNINIRIHSYGDYHIDLELYDKNRLFKNSENGAMKRLTYIHTTNSLFPKGQQTHLRHSYKTPTFYQNYLVMSNTADRW
jgi:hypothetical protein